MKKLLGHWFTWFSRTPIWKPLSTLLSNIYFGRPEFDVRQAREIIKQVKYYKKKCPHAVFAFTCNRYDNPINFLIRLIGYDHGHAGVFDPTDPYMVAEMKAKGFTHRHLGDLLKEVDTFHVYMFECKSSFDYDSLLKDFNKLAAEKPEYDFYQEMGNKLLYCSEMVRKLFRQHVIEPMRLRRAYGRDVYAPDHIADDARKIIYSGGRDAKAQVK